MTGKGDRLPVVARPCLTFSAKRIPTDKPGRPGSHTLADNLSAAAFVGDRLIVGGDEGDIIGLLDPVARGYRETGRIAVYGVNGIRRLSQGTDAEGGTVRGRDEIDIEGLAFEDGALWIAVHYLRLDGNGIRDLVRDGEDLLILSGPTMEEPGAAAVWRWREAFTRRRRDAVLPDDEKGPVIRIGSLEGSGPAGKPEAIAFLQGEPARLLVLRDGARHRPDSDPVRIRAEVVQLPGGNR